MALRNHREILSHRGLDVVPFFQQPARGDRLGLHTKQLSGLLFIARRRFECAAAAFVPSSMNETVSNSLAAK